MSLDSPNLEGERRRKMEEEGERDGREMGSGGRGFFQP